MRTVLTAAVTVMLLLIFCVPVSSAPGEVTSPAAAEYSEFFQELPDSVSDKLPDSSFGSNPEADAARLTAWDFLLGAVGEQLASQLRAVLPMFCRILGLILIAAALNAVGSSLEPKTAKILGLASACAVATGIIAMQTETLRAASVYLSDILKLADGMAPVVVTLYAAGGNIAAAGVSGSAMAVFMSFAENLLARTVIPFAGACLCLTTAQAAAPQIGLDGLIGLMKKTYTTFLTFLMSLLCAILAAQNAIAAGSDSVSLRAARFVAGSAIPVVGGSVGESMKTLAASIGMLRKCFGVTGIILIALMTLPTLILLLLTRFTLNVAAAAAELAGCDREKKLLSGISGIYGCIAAVVCACSLMFVFLLTLLAGGVTALGT